MLFDKVRRRQARAGRDRTSLGRILIDLGYCTEEELEAVLRRQLRAQYARAPSGNKPVGAMCVRAGIVTDEQLAHALMRQRVLRGQTDPQELKQYGADSRRAAISRAVEHVAATAESAGLLAKKVLDT